MRCCSIFGEVLREVLFLRCCNAVKTQRLAVFRHCQISMRFAVLFCAVFYIPVFLCGFAVLLCYSVRCLGFIYRYFCSVLAVFVPSLRPPLFRLLSHLKFYYMHAKVSCKGIDTEADLSVLIHANLISSTKNVTLMLKQTGIWKLFELR